MITSSDVNIKFTFFFFFKHYIILEARMFQM